MSSPRDNQNPRVHSGSINKGFFISFEGNETAGKTTQAGLLCERLQAEGLETVAVREPGGTSIGESVRGVLKDPGNEEMCCATELLLFAAARAQLVEQVIKPALAAGKIVIADRFSDSTTVYQGYAREQPLASLRAITDYACQGIMPALTFLLHVEFATIQKRLEQRGGTQDRFEREGEEFLRRVCRGYANLLELNPVRVREVHSDRLSIEDTAEVVYCIVRDRLQGGNAVLRNGVLEPWT